MDVPAVHLASLAFGAFAVVAALVALVTPARRSRRWSVIAFVLAGACAGLDRSHLPMLLASFAFAAPAVRWAITALWDAAD